MPQETVQQYLARGGKVEKCPPANCAGNDTNVLTRKEIASKRRKAQKSK